ncbi:hypothetical protein FY049_21040, partial [Acinetobacter sp. 1125_18A]
MDQIRPFPPTELIDQAEEEEAIRLTPAVDLKEWVVTNFLTLGGALHNPDHDHMKIYKALQPIGRFEKGDIVGGLSDDQIKRLEV